MNFSRVADLVAGACFLDDRRGSYPATCVLMFLQAASYALLRLWQEGYLPLWIDFEALWQSSLLSLEAWRAGSWYVAFTCPLVVYDLPALLFQWAGLWIFGAALERRFGSIALLLAVAVGTCMSSAAFLVTNTWIEAVSQGQTGGWQSQWVDWTRAPWRTYADVWLVAPLWWAPAFFCLFLQPLRRSFGMPLGLWVVAMASLYATGLLGYVRQARAFDSAIAAAALPLVFALVGGGLYLGFAALAGRADRAATKRHRRHLAEERALDDLLAKIGRNGLHSLTAAERSRLDGLSARLRG